MLGRHRGGSLAGRNRHNSSDAPEDLTPGRHIPAPWQAPRLAALLMLLCLALLIGGCGSRAVTVTRPAKLPLMSILQDDAVLQSNPAAILGPMHALGIQAVRTDVFWSHLAPDSASAKKPSFDASNPADYPASTWAVYDAIVRDAAADGIKVLFTVTGPGPLWAAGSDMPHTKNCPCGQWEPNGSDFEAFVHALGTRYSGHYVPPGASRPLPRVSFWSLWNEPNYGPNLAPQAIDHSKVEVSPRLYRGLLDAAWTGLQSSGHTSHTDTILIGETAPRGLTGPNLPGNFSGMVPLRFIRALYCVGSSYQPLRGSAASLRACPTTAAASRRFVAQNPGLFKASGWADHPYPDLLPPDVITPPPVGTDYADFAAIGNLEPSLDRAAAAYGQHPKLPIYSTEFAYKTDPPLAGWLRLPTAARYLNQGEYLSWLNPRIRSYDQYLLLDPPLASGSQFDTGLEFSSGAPKPDVYAAYRMPLWLPVTHGRRGSHLQVWGCVRPTDAVRRLTGRRQEVTVQFAPTGGGYRNLRTITLHGGSDCYFEDPVRFPSSGSVRLSWTASGHAIHSRVQTIRLS
jgi:hypothetical protein